MESLPESGNTNKRKRQTHGGWGTRLYRIWDGMLRRCSIEKCKDFKHYGAKGVRVCDDWLQFVVFRDWALANGYADHLTIERRDSAGNYGPSNCRWATMLEQENNRTNNVRLTVFGETKTVSEWSRDPRCVACVGTMFSRILYGMNDEDVVTKPIADRSRRKPKPLGST